MLSKRTKVSYTNVVGAGALATAEKLTVYPAKPVGQALERGQAGQDLRVGPRKGRGELAACPAAGLIREAGQRFYNFSKQHLHK